MYLSSLGEWGAMQQDVTQGACLQQKGRFMIYPSGTFGHPPNTGTCVPWIAPAPVAAPAPAPQINVSVPTTTNVNTQVATQVSPSISPTFIQSGQPISAPAPTQSTQNNDNQFALLTQLMAAQAEQSRQRDLAISQASIESQRQYDEQARRRAEEDARYRDAEKASSDAVEIAPRERVQPSQPSVSYETQYSQSPPENISEAPAPIETIQPRSNSMLYALLATGAVGALMLMQSKKR